MFQHLSFFLPFAKGILSLLFAISLNFNAFATIFYLDPATGSMSNPGTFSQPWSTLQAVFAADPFDTQVYSPVPYQAGVSVLVDKNPGAPVKAGDTLMLRTGNHGIVDYVAGFNSDFITIMPQPGHVPVIKVVYMQAVGKWRFKGLNFSAQFPDGYYYMFSAISHGWHGPAHGNVIENCHLYSIADPSGWTMQQWDTLTCSCIDLSGVASQAIDNHCENVNYGIVASADSIVVSGNLVENFVGDASRGNGNDLLFEYNVFKNLYKVNDTHNDGFQSWSDGGTPRYRVTLRGNVILNFEDPNQPFRGGLEGIGCFGGPYVDWVVENNVVAVDSYHGITFLGLQDSRLTNNTVVDQDLPNNVTANIFIGDYPPHGVVSDSVTVRNNISPIVSTPSAGAATFTVDHNFTDTNYLALFVDFANEDFHPKNDSVAFVDAGAAEGAPPFDLDQNARPMAAGFDIGAYEFQPPCDGENLVVNGSGAGNFIAPDTYWAQVSLTSAGVVAAGDGVIFKAGQAASLLPGFEVQAGGRLEIAMQNCQLP